MIPVHAAVFADSAVPVSRLAYAWQPLLQVLIPACVALWLFVGAMLRLRRRGRADLAPWTRLPLFAGGLGLLTLPLVSPLDPVADSYLLSAHMLEHVLIGDAGPGSRAGRTPGPPAVFFLPAPILRRLARLSRLRRVLAFMLRPRVALLAWAVVIGSWHVPAVYDLTLRDPIVHDCEHLMFVTVGFLVWFQLVDPNRRPGLTIPRRLGYAAVLLAMGAVLSDVLIFSRQPLYPAYEHAPARLFGLSTVRDQQLAGLVMGVEQVLTLGGCIGILLVTRLRRRAPRQVEPSLAGATAAGRPGGGLREGVAARDPLPQGRSAVRRAG